MTRRRKINTKKLAALLCALTVGVAVPCRQLIAFATDGNDPLYVRLPDATVTVPSAGGAGAYSATWRIDNQDVTLNFHSGLSIVDTDNGKAIPFADDQEIIHGLYAQYAGNFCDTYITELAASDGYRTTLSCDYTPANENGGNISEVSLAQDSVLPAQAEFFTLGVFARSQYGQNNPGDPQSQVFNLRFDNVDEYDENEGKYVVVHSNDQSLIGKRFKATSQDARIGARGDENGTEYSVDLPHDDFFAASYAVSGDFDPETAQVTLVGAEGYEFAPELTRVGDAYVFSMRDINFPGYSVNLAIQDKHEIQPHNPDEPQPHAGVETHSSVTVRSRANYKDQKSFYKARISINDTNVFDNEDCEWNVTNCAATYTRDDLRYNKEENVDTVELDIGSLFIYKVVNSKVIVNGVEYDIPFDYSNRAEWLAHYDHQMVGFRLIVPYAAQYDITLDVDDTPGNEQVIGNFLWTNDEREKTDPEGRVNDAYIGHSHLEVIGVRCHITENDKDDVYFSVEKGEKEPEGCTFEYQPDDGRTYGSLVVPEGSEVTVRLKTEYGYQVTSFGSNGSEIKADEGKIAEYTFGIFRGNFHLGAVVEKTADEVNAESKKVKSGSIMLGGEEIDEGTAMLSVKDANLSDEEKAQFQKEAGDYKVSTYLDIDLDQIFYDGHGGYWKGAEMKELEKEATITLTLEEGVNGSEVVLVHQKHDGTYEVIPTTYDAAKNTLTFKTSSFSNYAIAAKGAVAQNANPVNTLDNVMHYVALLTLCAGAIATMAVKARKQA